MLMPKRVKHRKQHRGRMTGAQQPGGATTVHFGQYGLQAMEPCWMSSNQIESARIAMTRKIRRGGKIWIRVFPDKPITKKPAETRMGKGKGAPEGWVAVVKPGRVLFEMSGVPVDLARDAMRLAAHKLPIRTKFVMRLPGEPCAPGAAELIPLPGIGRVSREIDSEDDSFEPSEGALVAATEMSDAFAADEAALETSEVVEANEPEIETSETVVADEPENVTSEVIEANDSEIETSETAVASEPEIEMAESAPATSEPVSEASREAETVSEDSPAPKEEESV